MTDTNPSNQNNQPLHFEFEKAKGPPVANNGADAFNVIVSVPESIQIRMVDASALGDYEVWVFIASLLSNALVGFLVAYFQAVDAHSVTVPYIGWTTAMFGALFLVSIAVAISKRMSLRKKSKKIRLTTAGASEVDASV